MAGHQDIEPAKETYSGFIRMVKWASIVVAISTVAIVFIIAGRAA